MFDVETSRLISAAPAVTGVVPSRLAHELTSVYAELAALRLRAADPQADPELRGTLDRLKRLAVIYEAAADTGTNGDARRASAFVAATAHQLLGRILTDIYGRELPLLGASAIHPAIAAPLLFLVAEQNPDACEAAKALQGRRADDLLRTALIETVHDLAAERFEQILERGERLRGARPSLGEASPESLATQALYGLCWAGILHMIAMLLDRDVPDTEFRLFGTPQATFDQVVMLSVEDINLPGVGGRLVSAYAGPRHLARLLRHVADGLQGGGIIGLPPPGGANAEFWSRWLRHRATTKPVLWANHRAALRTGVLEVGQSAVLVLPTGAGKTTLSELKVAATLAGGSKVIFLVPTLALVDQLRDELTESFPETLGGVEVSADGDLTGLVFGPELQAIEVMTPERCLALLSHAPDSVADVGLIVFDECHLLSPEGGGKRSLDAMLCLLHVLKHAPQADLLLLSAMLTNSAEVAAWLQETAGRPCSAFHDPWKPSRQARGVVVYPRANLDTISRSVRAARTAEKAKRPHPEPSLAATPYGLFGLHQNWNAGAAADTRLVRLSDTPVDLSLSHDGRPTPNANAVAARLAVQAATAGLKTIVFVQQAGHAPSTARRIACELPNTDRLTPSEDALWAAVKAELGGETCSLVRPEAGALPHNGDMIPLERRLAEALFRRGEGAAVIVATPTLAQGMNLPAQLAILSGDRRYEEDGRAALQAHEILNAAGRAGRAGHLANGVVLLIPEPVAAFDQQRGPDREALQKLRSVLPRNDQCVRIDDPLTAILDRIQSGNLGDSRVRYLMSRLGAEEDLKSPVDSALGVVRRSFAGFRAKQANAEAAFDRKVEALRAALVARGTGDADVVTIAATSGLPEAPLTAVRAKLSAHPPAMPGDVVGWSDWLIDFFRDDENSYESLLESDLDTVLYVVRGKKKGGPITADELERLKRGMRAWLQGRPFCEIEVALGARADRIGYCPRARDLALKLANRVLYLIAGTVAEIARIVLVEHEIAAAEPAVLETLAVAVRKGLDTADKVAFAYLRPKIRSRVILHGVYARVVGATASSQGESYATVLSHMTARLAFAGDGNS